MNEYKTLCFENEPLWDEVPEGELKFSNWDSLIHYNTCFKMCFVKNKGIFVKMKTDETDLRTENTKRDENIWEDSCMEFFLCPFSHREQYLNFEMNPLGAYLCQYGKGKADRCFISTLTELEPVVKAAVDAAGWSLELFVPCELISEVFGEEFKAETCEIRGNFYKCGDKTKKPHYDSFTQMGSLPPGFHNPECFSKIIINER